MKFLPRIQSPLTQIILLLWLVVFSVSPTIAAPLKTSLNQQFIEAFHTNDAEKMQSLLIQGADINAVDENGNSALLLAVSPPYMGGGDLETVRWLLRSGANLHLRNKHGLNALQSAAYSGWDDIIQALLSRGAKINEKDSDGATALLCASRGGITEIGISIPSSSTVELLLSRGAEVNATDNNGSTPLIEAIKSKGGPQEGLEEIIETVRLLLAKGANPNARTKNGNTALKWAILRHNREAIRLLKRAGSK